MLLLIMCHDLEVTHRRMTTAIKLVFAQAFVPGAASLVCHLMGNRVLYRCPFPQRGPSTLRLYFGAQLLLELFVLTDAQASALPVLDFGTLRAQGARITRRSWKLDMLAEDHRDALAPRTGHLHAHKVQRESILGKKRATLRPRTGNNVHALLRPLGNPWAGHVPQVDIELEQAGGFLQLFSQQLHDLMLWLIGRADHHFPRDFAIQIHRKVLLEAIEGFRAALAAVAHVLILDRDAAIRRNMLLDASGPRPSRRIWFRVLGHNLGNGVHHLLQGRFMHREGLLLRQPAVPSFHLGQHQAQGMLSGGGLSPVEIQRGLEAALADQHQAGIHQDSLCRCVQLLGREAHGLAQRMAQQVQRVLDPARAEQGRGVQGGPQLPRPKATGFLRQRHRPLQQPLVQIMRDKPHTKVEQGTLAEGGLLGTKTSQHHLPALVHHCELHRIPITDMAVSLQQRGQSQQPRLHGRFTPWFRAIALRQCVLQVSVQDLMASLAQKHKELARLAGARDNFLLFRGQRNGRIPHEGLLTVAGARDWSIYQSTNRLPLSTLYEAPSKQLISVLGAACLRYRTYTNVPESFWALQWVWLHPYARHKRLFTAAWPIWLETYGAVELEPPVSPTVTFIVRQTPTRTL